MIAPSSFWGIFRVPERCFACGQRHAPESYADVACRLQVMTEDRDDLYQQVQWLGAQEFKAWQRVWALERQGSNRYVES